MNILDIAISKSHTNSSLQGAGAIVGKNVQVSKIEPIIGGNKITFTYTLDNGVQQNSYLEVMNGEKGDSITSANIDESGILSFTLSNGDKLIAGEIAIDKGNINLGNYYTKDQTEKKFVQSMELDNLISNHIEKNFIAVSSEEINNLFIQ